MARKSRAGRRNRLWTARAWGGAALIAAGLLAGWQAARGQSGAGAPAQSNAPVQLITVPAEVPADAARYVFLLAGNKAGVMAAWASPDGARHNFFAFNDRGRGPSITTRTVSDRSGIPLELDATGNDYLKSPVEEHFRLVNGRATWKSKAENGEKRASQPVFYVAIDGVQPDELPAALLAAPGGKLSLLPEGEAHIEKVVERSIDFGGKQQPVTLYEIAGLSFTPYSIWLTADHRVFAQGSDWAALVREGGETAWPALLEAQKVRAAARGEEVARKLSRKPSRPLLITHARMFNSESATVQDGISVLISGNRIVAVGPDANLSAPGSEVLDAKGKMLLPGLWDMHVHLGDWDDGLLHMAAGVTSVRDMANDIDHLHEMQTRFDSGALIGPRIVLCGFIDGRGPYQGPTKIFADSPEEAVAQVDHYKSLGYEQIKLYSSLKPELVPVIAAEAHRLGMRLSGHVPAFMTMEQAIEQGYDEVQHANFWFLNFEFDQVKDTRTPARFTAVAEHAAALDLQSARVQAFVRLLQQHHSVVDPTVTVFEQMFVSRPGVIAPNMAAVADHLPAQIRRGQLGGGLPVPEGMDQRYQDSYKAMLRMLKLLYDAGITIIPGTDDVAGFTLHREMENYVTAGIPAPRVLQMATLGAARVMKHDDLRGSIAPGKLADVILVDGNPAERIAEIRRVVTVIKDGTVYDAGALYQALGVRPAN